MILAFFTCFFCLFFVVIFVFLSFLFFFFLILFCFCLREGWGLFFCFCFFFSITYSFSTPVFPFWYLLIYDTCTLLFVCPFVFSDTCSFMLTGFFLLGVVVFVFWFCFFFFVFCLFVCLFVFYLIIYDNCFFFFLIPAQLRHLLYFMILAHVAATDLFPFANQCPY